MTREDKASLLRELFDLCDRLPVWTYDANGTLLGSDCAGEAVLNTAFSAFGCQAQVLAAAARGDDPVMLGTSLGLVWGAAFEKSDTGALQRCWVLGPVFYTSVSQGQIELGYGNYQGLELSLAWKEQFMQAAARLPIVTNVLLGRYLLMLHYCLTGRRLAISDLQLPSTTVPLPEQGDDGTASHDRYQIYASERALLDMVRNGDLHYQQAFSNSSLLSNGVPVSGLDPLRQTKTSITVFTSLVCRAAIEGGLSPEVAYPLGDAYIQSAESARTMDELRRLAPTMYDDFIHRVHRCRTNPRYSPMVQKCVDYIDLHLEQKIQAADLAAQLGYDDYYITRRFKRETGYSLTNYIKFAKIERAKVLLQSTRLTVQQIADGLGFTTRSYFIQCFKAVTGRTPTAWRAQAGQ